MKKGWIRYTESLKKATDDEIAKFTEIHDLLASLKLANPNAGEMAEEAVAQQMSVPLPESIPMPSIPDPPGERLNWCAKTIRFD